MGDAGAPTAQNVGRPNNDRKADLETNFFCLLHVVSYAASRNFEAYLDHRQLEFFTILGRGNCLGIRTNQFWCSGNANFSFREQLHREIERSLPAESWQNCIWFFAVYDRRQNFNSEWLDVRSVGKIWISHDGGGVRVGQNDSVSLLAQNATSLSSRIIELTRLANDNGAGTDNQDRF